MPRRRYLPPNEASTVDNALPLDTQLTILTRQSTFKQAAHNLYSQERNPSELVHEAQRMGFASVKVYDWDTGIGAYSTTIEVRPGLRYWLNELLPNGISRVLMVSQEDRLFRDRWETQHNEFIRRVALHGGWVICGQRIYNFRREMDCEQFRLACKYGKQYIEHHIKGRLHPANHRNALSGRYAGGPVPWGYIVDYDRHNVTYKRLIRYEPHATLVLHHVFERFAAMTRPSVMELTRLWEREGRTWPFFGPEVDERRKRVLGQALARSDGASGYRFHYRQAQHILTNVAYLGWCVQSGEVAWDVERAVPLVCHEPLVSSDLFWWCYDLVAGERPSWAPPRPSAHATYYRPHHSRRASPEEVWFLVPGRVRCVGHGSRYSASKEPSGNVRLECPSYERQTGEAAYLCPVIAVPPVEAELIDAFREELRLDERDVVHLAQLAQRRYTQRTVEANLLQQELADQQALLDRAKRRALQVDDDGMAAEFLAEARRARETVQELQQRLAQGDGAQSPTADAVRQALRAQTLARRIWETFPEWPRAAQGRVLSLAVDHAVIGPVHRHALGFYIQWQGGRRLAPRARAHAWPACALVHRGRGSAPAPL
jgi:hypothetical protein